MITAERMNDLIRRAKNAATVTSGGGDGTAIRQQFSESVYKATLDALIAQEVGQTSNEIAALTISMLLRKLYETEKELPERNTAKSLTFESWIAHRFNT